MEFPDITFINGIFGPELLDGPLAWGPLGPPAVLTDGPPGPVLGPPGPICGPPGPPRLWSGCFKGWQTGQSFLVQLFQ